MTRNNKISRFEIFTYILLFLYFLSISAFQLETDFDKIFFRVIFVLMMIFSLFRKKKIVVTDVLKWNLVFWAFFFSSSLWASEPSDTFWTAGLAIQTIGIFFFLPLYIKDEDSSIRVLKILLLSLLCSIILLIIRTPIGDFGSERLGSTIGLNSNAFGLRMAIGAVISLYLLHKEKGKKMKLTYYIIALVLFAVFALFSGSKKALLTLTIGIPVCEIFLAKGAKMVLKILGILAFLAIVCMLIFNNQQLYDVVGSRVEKTFYTLTERNSRKTTDFSLLERQFYIDKGIEIFEKYPLAGYGGNNFVTYMREINYSHVAYSHNNYVELLATLGLIGIFIYYGFWLVITYRLIKIYFIERKSGDRGSISMLFLIIMMIMLILDYGMVSYSSDFNMIMLCLVYMGYWLRNQKMYESEGLKMERTRKADLVDNGS